MNRRRRRGFTLIELVLVLMIMGVALAVTAPSLRGWGETGRLRDAAMTFSAATTWARSRAVADAVTYRIQIDPAANTYVVQKVEGQQATAAPGEFGQATQLAQGMKIDVRTESGNGGAIEFRPDGRTTPATVRITSPSGNTIEIASLSPAESFAVVKKQ